MMEADILSRFEYRKDGKGMVVTAFQGREKDIVVPDQIDGLPVVRIADNAFRNAGANSIKIPASVRVMDEWFDPEEDVTLMLYGVPFGRLMSPRWRELGLRGYIAIRMEDGDLSEEIAFGYEKYIREHFDQFEERAISSKATLRCFMKHGLIPIGAVSKLLDVSSGDPELSASILEYRRKTFTKEELDEWQDSEFKAVMQGPTPKDLLKIWDAERLEDGSYKLTSWHGSGAVVHVPSRIGRIPVTAIGIDCFSPYHYGLSKQEVRAREEIIRVTIPDSVVAICAGAFRSCTGLESVVIPKTLKRLEDSAFAGCMMLREANVPDIPDAIGKSCFLGCRNLADRDGYIIRCGHLYDYYGPPAAHIPEGVTHISPRAFEEYTGLREVTFPDSLEAIEEFAFFRCTGLTEVSIPAGVLKIARAAFAWCTGIRELKVNEGTVTIGENAFRYCGQLIKAELPGSLKDIGFNILMDTGDLTVAGPAGSAIEKYAALYGHRFIAE